MKKEILELLLNNMGKYISGEEISSTFQVSRTAIWKQINSLKEAGYLIEASPRQGYRLTQLPDILVAEEILLTLRTKLFGHSVQVFSELSSTNDLAKKQAGEGAPEGTIILAEKQVQGRGRMGRPWESPAKSGLWLSIVLRPDIKPYLASQLIFVVAVGVCKALRSFTELDVKIKWPNDLLINGKKICGILTEMSAEIDMLNYIVIGIGLNVNQQQSDFSPELTATATSLKLATGVSYRRVEILPEILLQLEQAYQQYLKEGFIATLNEWKALNCTLGRDVKVLTREETFYGVAEDLSQDGSLLVRREDGQLQTVIVGDVSLRPCE